MAKLERCAQCDGFKVGETCPHCRATVSRLGVLATALGGSAFALTLMACYGCPPGGCAEPYGPDRTAADASVDDTPDPEPDDDASDRDGGDGDAAESSDSGDSGDDRDGGDADAA